jgi:hypothetical protein
LDGTGCAQALANTAADAAYVALLTGVCTLVFVGAFYHNVVGTFMDVDNMLRAGAHTRAAGDARIFVHHGHVICIEGNGVKLARGNTRTTAYAAVGALRHFRHCAAAAVAGYQRRFVGEFLFHSHTYAFLSYGVFAKGKL